MRGKILAAVLAALMLVAALPASGQSDAVVGAIAEDATQVSDCSDLPPAAVPAGAPKGAEIRVVDVSPSATGEPAPYYWVGGEGEDAVRYPITYATQADGGVAGNNILRRINDKGNQVWVWDCAISIRGLFGENIGTWIGMDAPAA